MECQFCDSNTYWSFKYPKQHIIVSGVAKFDRIFSNLLARRCITARDTNSARTFIGAGRTLPDVILVSLWELWQLICAWRCKNVASDIMQINVSHTIALYLESETVILYSNIHKGSTQDVDLVETRTFSPVWVFISVKSSAGNWNWGNFMTSQKRCFVECLDIWIFLWTGHYIKHWYAYWMWSG